MRRVRAGSSKRTPRPAPPAGECDEKLIPKHRRHWNEKKLGPPYVPEYTPTDKPGRSSCKIEFEAIFAWLGYH